MPTPVKLTIKFKADTLEEFVERYGVYVSQGGIFVRTKKPLSVGSLVDFEFKLQNGGALLKGMGTVVWTREHDPARQSAPAGMGLRYDSLDDESIAILGKLLALKESKGETEASSETGEKGPGETSPGGQQEKTRVASMDVLNALREQVQNEAMDEMHSSAPKPIPAAGPIDMDAPVDLDKSLEAASTQASSPRDDEATPLPQAAAPLLPMSEIRDPFDMEGKKEQESGEIGEAAQPAQAKAPAKEEPAAQPPEPARVESEVGDVLKELKSIAAAKSADKPAEPVLSLFDRKPEEQPAMAAEPEPEKNTDRELFDEIDKALDSSKAVKEETGKKPEPEKKTVPLPAEIRKPEVIPVLQPSPAVQEESSGAGKWIWVLLLVLALAGGAVVYWKFLRPQETGKPASVAVQNNAMGAPMDEPPAPMEPEMQPPPMDEPPAPMEPEMQPPPMDEPPAPMEPETAPQKQCADGEFALRITSVPTGATLVINMEKKVEKTPATFCVAANRGYTIAFEHPDGQPATEFISRLTQDTDVHKQLKPYPLRILVQSDPKGAQVFIDNEKIGPTTISKTFDAPQEVWKVEIRMPGYKTERFEIRGNDPKWVVRGRVKSYEVFKKLVRTGGAQYDDGEVGGGAPPPQPAPEPAPPQPAPEPAPAPAPEPAPAPAPEGN